ncbi:MAG: preprotein translocase subunit SecE [Alphaproteobacteria bacterium]|nr:preprotein translocase subunit SecE [Alphaproteobacteria bacterium]MBL0717790.1 preprotein translocase subunit SecE [Alphaproteobacteria bacterium]
MLKALTFFKSVIDEAKKVTWAEKKNVKSGVYLILIVTTIMTIFVYLVDLVFSWLMKMFLG